MRMSGLSSEDLRIRERYILQVQTRPVIAQTTHSKATHEKFS